MTLAEYLSQTGQKPTQFAASLGVPASTVTRIMSGQREARLGTAAKIVQATDGKVGFLDLIYALPDGAAQASSDADLPQVGSLA